MPTIQTPTPDNIARLPRWARVHIDTLKMRLQEAEAELDRLQKNEPTRVIADPYGNRRVKEGYVPTYLPEDRAIRFTLDPDRQFWIDVRLRDNTLDVMAATSVVIEPSASNRITVKESPR